MRVRLGVCMAIVVGLLGPVAGGARAADDCPNAGVREQQGSTWLPECRAFELVSPPVKNGNAVLGVWGARASGGGFGFWSPGAFAGAQSSVGVNYVALRGAGGWTTRAVNPPLNAEGSAPSLLAEVRPIDLSDDFSRALVETTYPVDPNDQARFASFGYPDLYRIEPDGSPTWASHGHLLPDTASTSGVTYFGASGDLDRVVFSSSSSHHPDVPDFSTVEQVYEWSNGQTHLLSRGVDGAPMPDGATVGSLGFGSVAFGRSPSAVSRDASRVAFTSPPSEDSGQVYVRLGRSETVQASTSQRTVPDVEPPRTSVYRDATPDTSKVLFSSPDSLTDDAVRGPSPSTDHTLYLYDVDADELENVSPYDNPSAPPEEQAVGPAVSNTIGISDDGRRTYFVASGRLVEPVGGVGPVNGERNVYVYDRQTGELGFVGTVAFGEAASRDDAEVSPSGEHLLLRSTAALDGGPQNGVMNWYLYEATSGTIACVSCSAQGNGIGNVDALFDGVEYTSRAPVRDRLSDDGRRVFFSSESPLVPADVNGVADAYEWVDGAPRLLTSGSSPYPSVFVGATPDGSEAFVLTNERLSGHDVDNGVADAYAVRVDGGFPEPPPAVVCTAGCRPPASGADEPTMPGSERFQGRAPAALPPRPSFVVRRLTAAQRARLARGRRVVLRVRLNRAGRVRLAARARLHGRMRTVATDAVRARKAGSVRLSLRLSPAARRQLALGRRLKLRVSVGFAGVREPRRLTVDLKGARR